MDTSEAKSNQITNLHFPVVGIGTAFSEIDLLKKIIADIPTDSGAAFLIIENLAGQQHSNLTEILLEHSKIPVHEVVNILELHPNPQHEVQKQQTVWICFMMLLLINTNLML
jgi:two-component system CheB/CheR fusion protein